MLAYYDSDDDVAWGPLTLREIKRTFNNPPARKVNRRCTVHAPQKFASQAETKVVPQTETKVVPQTRMNSDEGVSSLVNEEFEKCVTNSSNEGYSAVDHSYYTSCTENRSSSCHDILKDTHIKFLNLATNRQTEFDLRNLQQTLVECSTINKSSEGDGNITYSGKLQNSSIIDINDSIQSKNIEDDSLIVLSSDEENGSFVTAQSMLSQNTHASTKSIKREFFTEGCGKYSINCEHHKFENTIDLTDEENDGEEIEVSEHSISADEEISNHLPTLAETWKDVTLEGQIPQQCINYSPVQVPEINLAAFDESEDCLKFNDTLEEIERLLNAADDSTQSKENTEDLSSQGNVSLSSNSFHESTPLQPCMSPIEIISGSFYRSPSRSSFDGEASPSKPCRQFPAHNRKPTPRKLKIPTKIDPKFPSVVKMNQKEERVNSSKSPASLFRVPKTPIKPKSTVLQNKNIVSPVGLYIKYSPKAPLVTHVKSNNKQKEIAVSPKPTQKIQKNDKENEMLPAVVYKPARNQLFTVNEHLHLPPSIDKLVKKSNIIIHKTRIISNIPDKDEIERKLMSDSELTQPSISDSLLNETDQNVSVLMNRPAFK